MWCRVDRGQLQLFEDEKSQEAFYRLQLARDDEAVAYKFLDVAPLSYAPIEISVLGSPVITLYTPTAAERNLWMAVLNWNILEHHLRRYRSFFV